MASDLTARRSQSYTCPIRDVLDRVGDAWSVLVILELSRGACRFNALQRVISGISARMLSVTLRHLERDGLVTRKVLDSSPPQVEYALTETGQSLNEAMGKLAQWAEANQPKIRKSRADYDAGQEQAVG